MPPDQPPPSAVRYRGISADDVACSLLEAENFLKNRELGPATQKALAAWGVSEPLIALAREYLLEAEHLFDQEQRAVVARERRFELLDGR